jgi:hypothetical protein
MNREVYVLPRHHNLSINGTVYAAADRPTGRIDHCAENGKGKKQNTM